MQLVSFLFCIFFTWRILDAKYLENTSQFLQEERSEISPEEIPSVVDQKPSKHICLTPECNQTAASILNSLDPQVQPCDNFYKFACGKFLKSTIIPDSAPDVTTFTRANDKLEEQLRIIIEEESQPDEQKPFTLAKNLYKACMNKIAIEEKGLQPVLEILKSLGGWPVVEGYSWQEGNFEWNQNYFFDFSVVPDLKNNTRNVLYIDQPTLGLPRSYLLNGFNDKVVRAYYNYMVDLSIIYGANRYSAKREMRKSLEFEIKLGSISSSEERGRNLSAIYNLMTVKELSVEYPSIPWKNYLNAILIPIAEIDDEEAVIVGTPTFFKKIEKLMMETPERIQANYAIWKAIWKLDFYLNDEVRNRLLQFSREVSGQTEETPRWKECLQVTSEHMGLSIGALYIKKYFNEASTTSMFEMVENIRQEFKKILMEVDWMDEKTRKNALEKADAISSYIAYPEELIDDEKLEKVYENLQINPNDYFQSILNLMRYETESIISELKNPKKKSDWTHHATPATINAFYNAIQNSIEFPAGILQGVFFDNDRPRYMNYGRIGWIIGHEITHGFDNQGSQFDKEGNLVEWWDPETKRHYLGKAECIINQYGNYTAEEVDLKLNGIRTQRENIADNGGLKESYLAYQNWRKQNVPEPKLPGLNYSPSQLFWISAANLWCEKYRPDALKLYIRTEEHSPGEFRILGPFSNRPEFAKDFNCPLGSRMNPIQKCSVW